MSFYCFVPKENVLQSYLLEICAGLIELTLQYKIMLLII
jgi:hypothetical protein